MNPLEIDKQVKEKLFRAVAIGVLTRWEAEILPERLGCLAVNLLDSREFEFNLTRLPITWLLFLRSESPRSKQPSIRENINPGAQNQAYRWLKLAVDLGFLENIFEKSFDRFKFAPDLQLYFCAIFCKYHGLDLNIIDRTNSTVWNFWDDFDPYFPAKVWELYKSNKGGKDQGIALDILQKIGEQTFRGYNKVWVQITQEQIITFIIEALKDPDVKVRKDAVFLLKSANFSPRLINPLLEFIHEQDPIIRAKIGSLLGSSTDMRVIPALLELVHDENEEIRYRAALNLGWWRHPAAIGPLIQIVLEDDQSSSAAAGPLRNFKGNKEVADALIKALNSKKENTRWRVVHSLGRLGDKRAIEPLVKLLADKDLFVRFQAANSLTFLDSLEGFEILVDNLLGYDLSNDDYCGSISDAIEAMERIGDKRSVEILIAALDPDLPCWERRTLIVEALDKIGDKSAIPALIKLLDNEWASTRGVSVIALGNMGAEAALPKMQVIAENDSDTSFKGKLKDLAAEAIEKIRKIIGEV